MKYQKFKKMKKFSFIYKGCKNIENFVCNKISIEIKQKSEDKVC